MIFSKDVLFMHVPKTGGTSVTRYLLDVLPGPVYYSDPDAFPGVDQERIILVEGGWHERLDDAAELVKRYGFDIDEFPLILAVARNPYEAIVSLYHYLRREEPGTRGFNQDLALAADFETFAVGYVHYEGDDHTVDRYVTLGGEIPANLRIVRFEELAEGVKRELGRIGIETEQPFPWENRSQHGPVNAYYTRLAEEAVYQKLRWVFDQGYYPRMDRSQLAAAPEEAASQTPLYAEERMRRLREQVEYQWMREQVQGIVERVIPAGETVAVVSKGDEAFLELGERQGEHVPQDEAGAYLGYHPADGSEAVAQVEAIQEKGAGYLLIPQPSFWWLESYPELASYLETQAEPLWADDHCRIYALARTGACKRDTQDHGVTGATNLVARP
jgi:hypothetical protein